MKLIGLVWVIPYRPTRVIELDFGRDRLRVLRNRRTKVTRRLSRLCNVTVEPHPRAEREHVLVGWFGIEGAEKLVLVTRYEWPPEGSLFEVRQAVIWAIVQSGLGSAEQGAGTDGLRPPLD